MIICGFVWIISILMTLPQILYTKTEVRDQDTILCDIAFPDEITESDILNKIKNFDKVIEDSIIKKVKTFREQ